MIISQKSIQHNLIIKWTNPYYSSIFIFTSKIKSSDLFPGMPSIHNLTNPLKKLSDLRGVSFIWDDEYGGHDDISFIAEEVSKVLPSVFVYENNAVDASSMD